MKRRQPKQPQLLQQSDNEPFIKPTVQKKLKVGKPGDKYEVEADHMADNVVNNTPDTSGVLQKMEGEEEVQQKPLASDITPIQKKEMEEEPAQAKEIQRMEEEEPVQKQEEEEPVQKQEEEEVQKQEEEESVQAKCKDCEKEGAVRKMEEEEPVQKQEDEEVQKQEEEDVQKQEEEESVQAKTTGSKINRPSIESRLSSKKGSGSKMDKAVKTQMEQGFGADFSHVRIHTDSEAAQMSKKMGAQAFTHGNDIYFNKGKYDPASKDGKHLLAHELTHTIQQKGMVQKKIQKKPTYKGAVIKQDIDPLDSSTAPAGKTTAIGHTEFFINGHGLKNFFKQGGFNNVKNLLFPLPTYTKLGGQCYLLNKDLKLATYNKVRILKPDPWEKTMSKGAAAAMFDGALGSHIHPDAPAMIKVVIKGDPSNLKLRADDLKAEMEHATDDYNLFKKYLVKYQQDVNSLPNKIDSGYLGLGSCEARLEEKLDRSQRLADYLKERKSNANFHDGPGRPHNVSTSITDSSDHATLFITIKF
ncbi:DUF4157 domain-containing protein [Sungkyunkwania multivorans]|uniref:DUF4157 domain-containing protein n=1 Tax=Sungkyunkwania multivorans TaxID=1173618 RepID=A0ABW3CX88_9FLAO